MKYWKLIISSVLIGGISISCHATRPIPHSPKGDDPAHIFLKQYRYAQMVGDFHTASVALIGYLSQHEDLNYLDTLMQLYILAGNDPSAIAVGYRLMEKGVTTSVLLERLAILEKKVGLLDSAIVRYLTLYQQQSDPVYAYELAGIYFQKQDYTSMEKQLDKIFDSPKAHQRKVTILIQRQPQEIPLLAAAYNLRGYYFLNKGALEKAENDFKLSLQSAPDFLLPKNNLALIEQVRQQMQQSTPNADKKE